MGNFKIFSLVCIFVASAGVFSNYGLADPGDVELDNHQAQPVQDNPLYAFLDSGKTLTFEQMLETLQSEVNKGASKIGPSEIFYKQLPEYPGPKLADLIDAAIYSREKCTEAHFRRLVAWRQNLSQQAPLAGYLRTVIKNQRRFCDEFLNETTSAEVASFDDSTKAHFELFLKQDRVGQDFYVSPDTAIMKLRSLIGEPKSAGAKLESAQLISQSGQNFLTACREITAKLGPLVPIRRDHEIFARLPLRHENYFRVYNFCHHLIDFDFSRELQSMLQLDVHSRSSISEFGSYLGQVDPSEGQAAASDDDEKQISIAAVRYATKLASGSQSSEGVALGEALDHLIRSCFSSLDLAENLLWLRKHNLEGLRSDQVDKRAHHYLKTLYACNKLVRLEIPEILEQGRDDQTSRGQEKNKSNPIKNILLRIIGKA